MTAELTPMEGCRRKLHVELPAESVAAAYKKILTNYQRHAELPGFRKGKAPLATIERRFGSSITSDLHQEMTGTAWRDAIKEQDIKAVEIVDIENVTVSRTEGFSADYTFDVAPEFELPAYDTFSITYEKASVSDADIDSQIEQVRKSRATVQPAEEGHVIVDGDLVQGALTGSADGGPIDELVGESHKSLASTEGAWCTAGSEYGVFPGFGQAVTGLKAGDAVEFDAVFADDYYVEPLRGKTVHYKGTINKVSASVLPELNEEFLKNYGVETVDAFRTLVRNYLEQQASQANEQRKTEAICQYLLSNTTFDAPAATVDREAKGIVQEMISGGLRQGVQKDDILKDKEKIFENAQKLATDRVRVSWILGRIAEAEKISVTKAELSSRVTEIAERRQSSFEKTFAELERRGALEDIENAIRNEKAIDLLRERVKED